MSLSADRIMPRVMSINKDSVKSVEEEYDHNVQSKYNASANIMAAVMKKISLDSKLKWTKIHTVTVDHIWRLVNWNNLSLTPERLLYNTVPCQLTKRIKGITRWLTRSFDNSQRSRRHLTGLPSYHQRWGKKGKLPAIRINSRGDRRYRKEIILRLLGVTAEEE